MELTKKEELDRLSKFPCDVHDKDELAFMKTLVESVTRTVIGKDNFRFKEEGYKPSNYTYRKRGWEFKTGRITRRIKRVGYTSIHLVIVKRKEVSDNKHHHYLTFSVEDPVEGMIYIRKLAKILVDGNKPLKKI